ncbi:MAG TPA: hypothetical protein DEP99_03060 [Nitrospiraceae bacterium]|nr:hypothetical protein [Nitrospiraceae bacterium]
MYLKSNLLCQHLKGSPEGAQCSVMDKFIRSMEDADIRICMGERREECYIADALQQNNGQGIGVRLKVSD